MNCICEYAAVRCTRKRTCVWGIVCLRFIQCVALNLGPVRTVGISPDVARKLASNTVYTSGLANFQESKQDCILSIIPQDIVWKHPQESRLEDLDLSDDISLIAQQLPMKVEIVKLR